MADKKRSCPACVPLSESISAVLQKCGGGEEQNARAVWGFWDQVVGETMARNARPAAFKQRILMVHVSSSVWLQEMHFRKTDLIERLNLAAGARVVEDIRFKIGSLANP
jgi:predicted nucleic acid-binding Zn ribbon protein